MILRRALRAAIAISVAAAVCAPSAAIAVTRSDLERAQQNAAQHRQKAAEAERLADQLLEQTKQLETQIDALEEDLADLQGRIDDTASRRRRLEREITQLRGDISVKEALIADTQERFDTQQALLDDRMRDTYKQGSFFYFELLLDAEDFGDLIARTSLVQRVIGENQRIALELRETKLQLEAAKDGLERDLQSVEVKRAAIASEERKLKGLRDEQAVKLTQRRDSMRQKTELVAENRANAERLRAQAAAEDRESARIAAELAKQASGSGVFNGVMQWPVPASQRITSPFGWRRHPILGYNRFHSGIDIGAGSGSTIVAASSGRVIYAGYRGGYGNTIMIDHGDGVVTLYGHQSRLAASNGQSVSKGQTIGYVGSTGLSTGPHLHFEVRSNGSPVDPMKYLR